MFEFTIDVECAGHPIGSFEVGVDATMTGRDSYDLNGIFIFIAIDTNLPTRSRYIRASDRRVVKIANGKAKSEVWREVPCDDVYFTEIMEAVEARHDEIMKHLHADEVFA